MSQIEISDDVPVWRKCEVAWIAYLATSCVVTRLADAHNNHPETGAPMIQIRDRLFRAPDVLAIKDGRSEYWEVKYRKRAETNRVTGQSEYWMSRASFEDYCLLAIASGTRVSVILYDGEVFSNTGRWLFASVDDLRSSGRVEIRYGADAVEVEAWVWPASSMRLIAGPTIDAPLNAVPLLVPADNETPIANDVIEQAERKLRRHQGRKTPEVQAAVTPAGVFDMLRFDGEKRLDALRRRLGIPECPRYSVLRIGTRDLDIDELLGILSYGIRVFIVTETTPEWELDPVWLGACEESRLLEWAVIPGAEQHASWFVDGALTEEADAFLETANSEWSYNHRQYKIVHRPIDEDVLVTAGAGTGKTETMAERIVFLLATSRSHADPLDEDKLLELGLDEIVLMTFTREAASEMRQRIGRTLLLRQRLCEDCVLPTIDWLLRLSKTEIETIHTYSKKVLQRDGTCIGLTPSFAIGEQTMEFRRALDEALSPRLSSLLDAFGEKVPPAYALREHAEFLWKKMAGNGFSPLANARGRSEPDVSWGAVPPGLEGAVSEALREVIASAASIFLDICSRNQKIPVAELIPTAARAIAVGGGNLRRPPRYVFVDEFQDTDSEQIAMLLDLRLLANARLFVVGDEKQGIYRFRGAQGNAFNELQVRAERQGLAIASFGLTRNFRSARVLLDSLDSTFASWGDSGYLRYGASDRLVGAYDDVDAREFSMMPISAADRPSHVVETVGRWRRDFPSNNVAVLCRTNNQALEYQKRLREVGIPCDIRVGGEFFRAPVVRELRVFLESVLNPDDDAGLLELTETRWFPGLSRMAPPPGLGGAEIAEWPETVPPIVTWPERLSSLATSNNFERGDLDILRRKVRALRRLLDLKPALGWLMDCDSWMQPRAVNLGQADEIERARYGRGFDHLITLLDESFGDAPISPVRLLEWLRLKIATDHSEDEPTVIDEIADVTALTVHKAKGLEFDRVIIPTTTTQFADEGFEAVAAIVPEAGRPRLLWKWKSEGLTNVAPADRRLWNLESDERIGEEARLLYVAMTRARLELEILTRRSGGPVDRPGTWSDLLYMAGRL
jgi:DNA helicase-2/ATP-dependent DNA helicase PcrA